MSVSKKGYLSKLFYLSISLLLVVLITFFFNKNKIYNWAKVAAEQKMAASLSTDIQFGDIEISLVPTTLSIKNVSCILAGSTLTVDEVRIRISPWSFFTEKKRIGGLALIHPVIRFEAIPGKGTLPDFSGSGFLSTGGKAAVVVRKIVVENGEISIINKDRRLSISKLDMLAIPDLYFNKVSLDFSSGRMEVGAGDYQYGFNGTRGSVNYKKNLLSIKGIKLDSDKGGQLSLNGDIRNFDDPLLDLFVVLKGRFNEFVKRNRLPIRAGLQFSGSIKGKPADPLLDGTILLDSGSAWGIPLDKLESTVETSLKGQQVTLKDIMFETGGTVVNAALQVSWNKDKPQYLGHLKTDRFNMEIIKPVYGDYPLDSLVTADIAFAGSKLDALDLSGSLKLERAKKIKIKHSVPGILRPLLEDIRELSSDFHYKNKILRLEKGKIDSELFNIAFFGNAAMDDLNLNIIASTDRLSGILDYFGPPLLGEHATLVGRLTGSVANPTVDSRVWGRDIYFHGKNMGNVKGGLTYHALRLGFEHAVSIYGKTTYHLNGGIDFVKNRSGAVIPRLDINFSAKNASPNTFIEMFYKELPIYLPVNGSGNVNNIDTARYSDYVVNLDLGLGAGSIYKQQLDSGSVRMAIDKHRILFLDGRVKKNRGSMKVSGMIDYSGNYEVSVDASRMEFGDIYLFGDIAPLFTGTISGTLEGSGKFAHPALKMDATIADSFFLDTNLGFLEGLLELKGDMVDYHIKNSERFEVDGQLMLADSFPYNGELLYSMIQLDKTLHDIPVHILTSGIVNYKGNLLDSDSFSSAIEASRFEVNPEQLPRLWNNGNILLNYSLKDDFTLKEVRLMGRETEIEIEGRFGAKELSIIVSGNTRLKNIKRFLGEKVKNLNGKTVFALKVQGGIDSPDTTGKASFENATVLMSDYPEPIRFGNAEISFDKKKLIIESAEGAALDGTFTANGVLEFPGSGVDYELFLDFNAVQLEVLEEFRQASLDGNLLLKGAGSSGNIIGEIFINSGIYKKRKEWRKLLFSNKKPQGLLKNIPDIGLNVRITNRRALRISNNLALMKFDVDLLAGGTLARPIVTGRIDSSSEGLVFFLGNEFKIVHGVMSFSNPQQTEAELDILALTTVKEFPDRTNPRLFNEYDIRLNITTKNNKLDLNLESDPPLSETDILALLTVGLTAQGIAETSGDVGAAGAFYVVAGALQQEIESNIESLVGLNKFQIDPSYSSTNNRFGPKFTVGKRLFGDRLIVSYSTTLDLAEEQFVELEYLINDNLSLLGERDEVGRLGGELQYRFTFE